jgi:5-methylcytosine-specific restriction endonuclease McrA
MVAMTSHEISSLSDHALLRGMTELFAQARVNEAEGIRFLAEVDARQLYRATEHASMFDYCVRVMHMSDDVALRRIRAARLVRRFPRIVDALADGRLHLTALTLLSPHLNEANAAELLAAAEHRTKTQIEVLLARRFPQPDVAELVRPVASAAAASAVSAAEADLSHTLILGTPAHASAPQLAPERVGMTMPEQVAPPVPQPPRARVAPIAPERFAVQLTIGQATHDKLRYAQALLGHAVPSGELAQVLDRALDALICVLEKNKFAATSRTRPGRRSSSSNPRQIAASTRRAVWHRDGGQCTFTSDKGTRCESRTRLEYDHVQPVARGGDSTVGNLRLRCRAHNQYEAERVFGAGFMHEKRAAAGASRTARAARRSVARPGPARASHPVAALTQGAGAQDSARPPGPANAPPARGSA